LAKSFTTEAPRSAAESKPTVARDLSGFYQLFLSDDCPVAMISIPCIEKPDEPRGSTSSGVPRVFRVTVEKQVATAILECSDEKCPGRWLPERPMRPGSVLKMQSERRWLERYQKSFTCPKCGKRGKRPTTPSGNAVTKHVRPIMYLTDAEIKRFVAEIDPDRKPIPVKETVTDAQGQKHERTTALKNRPIEIVFSQKGEDGRRILARASIRTYVRMISVDDTPAKFDVGSLERLREATESLEEINAQLAEFAIDLSRADITADERVAATKAIVDLKFTRAKLRAPTAPMEVKP